MTEKCKNCKYYISSKANADLYDNRFFVPGFGLCRVHSVKPLERPKMSENDWCGDYSKSNEIDEVKTDEYTTEDSLDELEDITW